MATVKNFFNPLEDRILLRVKKETEPKKTETGLYDLSKKETEMATVYAAGIGWYARETGNFVPAYLSAGDVVVIGKGAGLPIDIELPDGSMEEMKLLREGDVLILVSKKESTD